MRPSDRAHTIGEHGRRLHIREWGPESAPAIVLVHGFPGCADQAKLLFDEKPDEHIRLIAMDRPGYGASDSQRRLGPSRFARQFMAYLDEHGISKISIISVSGGAPYALALASVLGDRVSRLSSIGGVAPLTVRNFRYLSRKQKQSWALRNFVPDPLLRLAVKQVWQRGVDNLEKLMFQDLNSYSPMDRKVFEHPRLGAALLETTRNALAGGPDGVLEDMRVYSRSWGFHFSDVKCPVTLWHGTADDIVNVRFAREMARRLPQARLNIIENEGHYSLLMNLRDEILAEHL